MRTIEKYFYLCNGKMWCNKRADGRKNEFCQANALDTDYCYHTSNKDFRKHKDGHVFKTYESDYEEDGKMTHYIYHFEMDNKFDDDFYKRKVKLKMDEEKKLLEKGGFDEE